jgi:hypothetical protein
MPAPFGTRPIEKLSDARDRLGDGLDSLVSVVAWVAHLGYGRLGADLRRHVSDVGSACHHVLDHVRDEHPDLDDLCPDDEEDVP